MGMYRGTTCLIGQTWTSTSGLIPRINRNFIQHIPNYRDSIE